MITLKNLTEEAKIELSYLLRTAEEVEDLLLIIGERIPTRIEKAAAIQYISQFYNGIENILKRIVKYNRFPLPKSEDWHTQLIMFFDENHKNCKIPLFFNVHVDILNSFRKTRHVMRQGYNFQMEWDKLVIALHNIPSFLKVYEGIIMDYINSLNE
jgi:hypothetical protein